MSYIPASRQIGGVELSKSSDSSSYRIKYFVLEEDLESYVPAIGDAASWAPEPCSVTAFSKSWYGPGCWMLSVTAKPYDSSLIKTAKRLDDFIKKSYSLQDLRLPARWWGAWLATKDDCPQFNASNALGKGERRHLNVSGAWCKPGDAVFANAVPYELDVDGLEKTTRNQASKGSADYAASPFLNEGVELPLELIEQVVKAKRYDCGFYTRRPAQNISDFVGVSGEFSGSCRPAEAETGRWKALSQSVENIRDREGLEWTHVTRSMLQAPFGLKWDPDKNGGTWKW